MISVIIPSLNEAGGLPRCLASLAGQAEHELILADGGSVDATVELAEGAGAQVVACAQRGRAAQLDGGARRARGDILLFLHADARLPAGALAAVERAVVMGAVGGCFRLRLEDPPRSLAPLVPLGDLHCRATRTTFGDRAVFARRDAFWRAGGFPLQEIMEDVELGRRLKRLGPVVVLPLTVRASARHFRDRGGLRVALKAVCCCALYDLGVAPRRLARFYWGAGYAAVDSTTTAGSEPAGPGGKP